MAFSEFLDALDVAAGLEVIPEIRY